MDNQTTIGKQCLLGSHEAVFNMVKAEFNNWDNTLASYKHNDKGIHLTYMGKYIGYFESCIGWVNSFTWFVKVQFVPSPDFWILKNIVNGKEENKSTA